MKGAGARATPGRRETSRGRQPGHVAAPRDLQRRPATPARSAPPFRCATRAPGRPPWSRHHPGKEALQIAILVIGPVPDEHRHQRAGREHARAPRPAHHQQHRHDQREQEPEHRKIAVKHAASRAERNRCEGGDDGLAQLLEGGPRRLPSARPGSCPASWQPAGATERHAGASDRRDSRARRRWPANGARSQSAPPAASAAGARRIDHHRVRPPSVGRRATSSPGARATARARPRRSTSSPAGTRR